MYYALLGRGAETGGFNYWKGLLDGGQATRAQIVPVFLRSDEAVQRVAVSRRAQP